MQGLDKPNDHGQAAHGLGASRARSNENGESASKTAQHTDCEQAPRPSRPVAIVLAGAGARGAYEAGFIATLLPHLDPRPTIFVGTSAGAINAALLAATADLTPEKAGDKIMKSWGELSMDRVFRPLWKSVPRAAAKYLLALAFGTKAPMSFADTTPLQAAIQDPKLLDWNQVHENIAKGLVDALAVVATETGSGRSKVFYATRPGYDQLQPLLSGPPTTSGTNPEHTDETRAIDYVKTELTADHVRASAAIPVLFPPVTIEINGLARYFIDGGIRLNAPLKPALQLGASGLVVVSTDPRHFETSLAVEPRLPTIQGQLLQVLRAVFADRMIEDIRTLLTRNRKAHARAAAGEDKPADSKRTDRVVPVIFGGPLDQDRVGGVASRALAELLRGFPGVRYFKNIDIALLNFLTSMSGTSGPDLISYILFEPGFLQAALRAGIQDASALLNDHPNPDELWNALAARDCRHRRSDQGEGAETTTLAAQAAA